MQATETLAAKTGAEQAAETLAEKLRAAGWDIRLNSTDSEPARYSDGRLMFSTKRQAALHAYGPRAAGQPYLHAYWNTVTEAAGSDREGDTQFRSAQIHIGGTNRELDTWGALDTWVDALIAVAAAVDA